MLHIFIFRLLSSFFILPYKNNSLLIQFRGRFSLISYFNSIITSFPILNTIQYTADKKKVFSFSYVDFQFPIKTATNSVECQSAKVLAVVNRSKRRLNFYGVSCHQRAKWRLVAVQNLKNSDEYSYQFSNDSLFHLKYIVVS